MHDPTLRLLLSQINAFRMGLPPHLRRPTQDLGNSTHFDRDLVAALMIVHAWVVSIIWPDAVLMYLQSHGHFRRTIDHQGHVDKRYISALLDGDPSGIVSVV